MRPDRFISHLRICSGSQSISETVPVRLGTTSSRSPRSNEPNASSCRPISSPRTSQNTFVAIWTSSRLIFPVCGILVTLAPVTQPAHVAPIQVLSAPPAAKSSPPVPIGVLRPCICVILATLEPVLPMQYSPPGWVLARSLPTKPLMRHFQKYEAELGRNA